MFCLIIYIFLLFLESFVTKTIKKRNKRNRTSYTTDQLKVLERTFARTKYINTEHRKQLAESLKIGEKCIKIWFQNRRMKEKRESSESSCDSSSDGCIEPTTPPPPPVIQTASNEEQYIIPSHYNPVYNQETEAYYQYANGNKEISQLHTYYENYNASLNMDRNTNGFTSENFRNDHNIYPTHYYPNTDTEYIHSYTNLGEYQQPREEQNWSATGFDLNFL